MIKKKPTTFQTESQTFKAYKRVRQSNTFKSQILGSQPQNNETIQTARPSIRTYKQEKSLTQSDQKQPAQKVRISDTYRHYDIFSPLKTDNDQVNTSRSKDNSFREASPNNTDRIQTQMSITLADLQYSRGKKINEAKSDIFNQSSDNINRQLDSSYKKININEISPVQWQNSQIYPGQAAKCNEQVKFDRNFSRERKLKDNEGSFSRSRNVSNHEPGSQRLIRKRSSNSAHLDGRSIFPTTISWNQFDSLSYRKARLQNYDDSARSLNQQSSVSAFRKMMKEKQSSMDQHRFYEGAQSQRPQSITKLSKNYKCTSQDKILAFLNGNLSEVSRDSIGKGQKRVQEGGISNNLYGVTQKSPEQPSRQPDVLSFSVNKSDQQVTEQFKNYCKENGYGLVKYEQHENKLTHEPLGTATFTLRVKEFLEHDTANLDQFFKCRGVEIQPDNQNKFRNKGFEFQEKESIRKRDLQRHQNKSLTDVSNRIHNNELQILTSSRITTNQEESTPSKFGRKVTPYNDKRDNTIRTFEKHLRAKDDNSQIHLLRKSMSRK